MQGHVFYSGVAAFLVATAIALVVPLGWWEIVWMVMIGGVLGVVAMAMRASYAVLLVVIISTCTLAWVRVGFLSPVTHPDMDAFLGQKVRITGELRDEVDEREANARLAIQVTHIDGVDMAHVQPVRVLALVAPHPVVSYGDTVVVEGTLKKPEVFETDAGRLFDYPQYLAVSGIGYTMSFGHVVTSEDQGASFRRFLFSLKDQYLDGIGQALVEPYAALAGGLTVGDKRALGGELLDTFRDAGIVHIVVLSGFNITIIIAFLLGWMSSLSRKVQLMVGTLVIIAFVLMTGASATGVRAGIMAALALMATVLARQYAIMRALAVAAIAMVLWNPRILLYDPGFQLSVVATMGLVAVAPRIAKRLLWLTERFGLREIVASTIGTQIAVLPLLIYQIGEVSLVALPANLLVLPTVPFAMLFASVAGLYGMIGLPLAAVVGYPSYLLLLWIVFVAEWAAAVSLGTVVVPVLPLWVVGSMYAVACFWLIMRPIDSPPHSNSGS